MSRSRLAFRYVNFLGDEGQARVREAYPGATWDRLADVKRRYDPRNLFRLNQNIAVGVAGLWRSVLVELRCEPVVKRPARLVQIGGIDRGACAGEELGDREVIGLG